MKLLTHQNFKSLIFTTGFFASLLAFTVPNEAQARRRAEPTPAAPTCDISVERELTDRTHEQRIKRFTGNRDYIGRKWWLDLAMVPADLLIVGIPAHARGMRVPGFCVNTSYWSGRYDRVRVNQWTFRSDGPNMSRPRNTYSTQEECETQQRLATAAHRMYADRETASWDELQKVKVEQDCNDYIRNHFENTIVSDDGNLLFSRNYYCSAAVEVLTNHERVRRWASYLVRYTPAVRTVTNEQIQELRCQKVRACQVRAASSAEFQMINQLNLDQGCDLQ